MKPLSQMTHYEVLEVGRDASPDEVERAYRLAAATFAEESLATYSLYDESESAAMRERVELAYRILTDVDAKVAYDGQLDDAPPVEERRLDVPVTLMPDDEAGLGEVRPEIRDFDDLDPPTADGEWDGARLRRARLGRGIEIEKIAEVTKINPNYLEGIEADAFDELPATVYVRGFVAAYARALGIEEEHVVPSYVARLREARPEPTRWVTRGGGRRR